ncbi:protein NO VEIN domain-containing protein [Ralstonia thomasii]
MPTFDISHNEAFRSLGAKAAGQHWSAFDVPKPEARKGNATRFVTTIWNYHSKRDERKRRVPAEIAICKDRVDGSYWYRVEKPILGTQRTNWIAHWDSLLLAVKLGLPIIGFLKDYKTKKCSSNDVFDCVGALPSNDAAALWLQLRPRGNLDCETRPIEIAQFVGAPKMEASLAHSEVEVSSTGSEMSRAPFLVCNIGWMRSYRGVTKDDAILGGGRYVQVNRMGHEACNFLPIDGQLYGYVQPVGKRIRIERLGANSADDKIAGVDVVLVARNPHLGGTRVVGWYKNATVYEELQEIPRPSVIHTKNGIRRFRFSVAEKNAVLLSPLDRHILVPRKEGGIGHSNVWFPKPDHPVSKQFIEQVLALMATESQSGSGKKSRGGGARQPDPLIRHQVEMVAMDVARQYYEKHGYDVEYVHKENLGWDIHVFLRNQAERTLAFRVEVKGLSGSDISVQLTPNEYGAFEKKAMDYHLCVVTNTLANPTLHVFAYNPSAECWMDTSCTPNVVLKIRTMMGAVITTS